MATKPRTRKKKAPPPLHKGDYVVCTTGALAGAGMFTSLVVIAADPAVDAYDVALENDPTVVWSNVDRTDLLLPGK